MKPITNGDLVALRVAIAEQEHIIHRMAAQAGPGGSLANARHPWFASITQQVILGIADHSVDLCPHVGPFKGGLGPMYAMLGAKPLRLQCRLCLVTHRQRLGLVDDFTCDRCSVYTRSGLVLGALPIGPLLLHFGVCRPCGTELSIVRAKVPA